MLGLTLVLLTGVVYLTGRCFASGVSVVSGRSAETHGEPLRGALNTYAKSGFMFSVAKAPVPNHAAYSEVQFSFPQSSIFGWTEMKRRVFLEPFFVRWVRRQCIVQVFWVIRWGCQILGEYFFNSSATTSEPCWTSPYVLYDPLESYRPWGKRSSDGRLNVICEGDDHDPWPFDFCNRFFSNVRLALDREQSEESDNHIGRGNADHDPFRDTRLWSQMLGILLFLLGCGFAYNAARFWIYSGRRGISASLIALSFACLFIGQAFVLFGFWWL